MSFSYRMTAIVLGIAIAAHVGPAFAMTDQSIVIGFRFAERLIVAVGGIVCLILGYRLFSQTDDSKSLLEAQAGARFFLRMQRVGPGIFFALFGTALLTYVMASNISLESSGSQSGAPLRFGAPASAPLSSKERSAHLARQLDLVESYAKFGLKPSTPEEQRKLLDAIAAIDQLKGQFVDDVLGSGTFADLQTIQVMEQTQPNFRQAIDPERRARIEAANRLLQGGQ